MQPLPGPLPGHDGLRPSPADDAGQAGPAERLRPDRLRERVSSRHGRPEGLHLVYSLSGLIKSNPPGRRQAAAKGDRGPEERHCAASAADTGEVEAGSDRLLRRLRPVAGHFPVRADAVIRELKN